MSVIQGEFEEEFQKYDYQSLVYFCWNHGQLFPEMSNSQKVKLGFNCKSQNIEDNMLI